MAHDLVPRHSTFDLSGLGPIPQVPLVPEPILRRHHCFIPADHRFKAAARLLQSLWREDRDLQAGSFVTPDRKRRRLGSRLPRAAGNAGANFLTPSIARDRLAGAGLPRAGAVFAVERLKTNLLASIPPVFNAFAPRKQDLALATRVLDLFLPGFRARSRTCCSSMRPPGVMPPSRATLLPLTS